MCVPQPHYALGEHFVVQCWRHAFLRHHYFREEFVGQARDPAHIFSDSANAIEQQGAIFRRLTAHGQLQVCGVRNDVVFGATVKSAHGNYAGSSGRQRSADHGLQPHHNLRAQYNRIDPSMR